MKRLFKEVLLFILFLFICPLYTYADNDSSYIPIDQTTQVELSGLSITCLSFEDYSHTSMLSFGLSGIVNNFTSDAITYTSNVYYYDENYQLIGQYSKNQEVSSGSTRYVLISNLNTLNNHQVSDIKYYKLDISNIISNNNSNYTPSEISTFDNNDYVIDSYDIQMIVNEDNTFDITETIDAYFQKEKHGIIRNIPLSNTITRLDGTSSTNHAQLSHLNINRFYIYSQTSDTYKIRIGSLFQTVSGKQQYIIKYHYNLGKDPIADYDDLYFNLIGTEWDTVIGNVTFTIQMPKSFDASKLGFSTGAFGSINNDNIQYRVDGNTITGKYKGILNAYEGITVRCELPEGYFVGAHNDVDIKLIVIYAFSLIGLLVSFYLWYRYGKDSPVVETVEFYPPDGLNSLELGYCYNGVACDNDVISLVVYLANKGYIKIEDLGTSEFNNDFKIIKLKEYDGNNQYESLFMKGLFEEKNEVTQDDLENKFYHSIDGILEGINIDENHDKIYDKKHTLYVFIIKLFIIITFIQTLVVPVLVIDINEIMALIFISMGLFVLIKSFSTEEGITDVKTIIYLAFWALGFIGLAWVSIILPVLLKDIPYLFANLFGICCIAGMLLCLNYLPKRTPYGVQILGKIKGFKTFLETSTKDELEDMVTKNPTYYYDILPYAYVLGVSDVWIKKFESIAMVEPQWYSSNDSFNWHHFNSFMNNSFDSTTSVLTSSPTSRSSSGDFGGGSSGGGSSGGGSGGGGGSSW